VREGDVNLPDGGHGVSQVGYLCAFVPTGS